MLMARKKNGWAESKTATATPNTLPRGLLLRVSAGYTSTTQWLHCCGLLRPRLWQPLFFRCPLSVVLFVEATRKRGVCLSLLLSLSLSLSFSLSLSLALSFHSSTQYTRVNYCKYGIFTDQTDSLPLVTHHYSDTECTQCFYVLAVLCCPVSQSGYVWWAVLSDILQCSSWVSDVRISNPAVTISCLQHSWDVPCL